jgi:hypothetical protein
MVASISARGGAKAALSYYGHLRRGDYYARGGEPPGRWAGEAAERLSLKGPVTQTEFDAAMRARYAVHHSELAKADESEAKNEEPPPAAEKKPGKPPKMKIPPPDQIDIEPTENW